MCYMLRSVSFEAVDPAVADSVAELLFLSVQDVLRTIKSNTKSSEETRMKQ